MSQRKDNDIWYNLFASFTSYLKSDKYTLNQTAINVIKIVDYKVENISDENSEYINVNVPGNYFVKEDNSIYDQNLTLIQALNVGDSFTYDPDSLIEYFIASDENEHELNDQWNNSLLGDNGISITMGGLDVETEEDEENFKTWTVPQVKLQFGAMLGVNALERKNTADNKDFEWAIFIAVKELDAYENMSGYDELNRVKSIMSELIYDFGNSKLCAHAFPNTSELNWEYDFVTVYESRPMVVTAIENKLTYR